MASAAAAASPSANAAHAAGFVASLTALRAAHPEALDAVLQAAGVPADPAALAALPEQELRSARAHFVNVACSLKLEDPAAYDAIACRVYLDTVYEETHETFGEYVAAMRAGDALTVAFADDVAAMREQLDAAIDHGRDVLLDIFGLKTLECGYLIRDPETNRIAERPQYMFMRVAVGIHGRDVAAVLRTYEALSLKRIMHATPTLFNTGTRYSQLSSCFLLPVRDDSVEGIYGTVADCAQISKHAGGIGLAISNVRAKGSMIKRTGCTSGGIVPMLRVFNSTVRHAQVGRRASSVAAYLEPWHADVEEFLELRKTYGNEEQRTRDLFTALWVPDLFMERVERGEKWSLMSPCRCPGLDRVWGDEFRALYERYEAEGKYVRQVDARDLFNRVLQSQMETGLPYMLYKDACNAKSNQANLGTIRSSNLCAEIVQYSDDQRVAVCNLASVGLPSFVRADGSYDFDGLHAAVELLVDNLNKVVDRTFYPLQAALMSNAEARPIGIGVQGLADVMAALRLPFDSVEALDLNERIAETIYHAAVSASCCEPERAYAKFAGSPASQGRLQFDLHGFQPRFFGDWDALRARASRGMRNSLLVALMPTASTSQVLGFNECFEPYTSTIYKRSTLAGEFIVINRYLHAELARRGLWTREVRESIMLNNGSVQQLDGLDEATKAVFKTAWEIKQRALLDMAVRRAPYVCQSQSMNVFMEEPSTAKLTALHFYGWRNGLKTGMYYLRTRPKATAQKFTIDPSVERANSASVGSNAPAAAAEEPVMVCTRGGAGGPDCAMCSA